MTSSFPGNKANTSGYMEPSTMAWTVELMEQRWTCVEGAVAEDRVGSSKVCQVVDSRKDQHGWVDVVRR
jgi:hypothetical protein